MTKIDSPPRRRIVLLPVFGALAAIAAGAVLYETARPAGKAASDCPADSARLAAKLAPLARDDLAALAVASEPRRAEQFAFEREDGGKLTLANYVPDLHRDIGDAVIFPSFMAHKVTTVAKGTRHTLVAWAHGQPFR